MKHTAAIALALAILTSPAMAKNITPSKTDIVRLQTTATDSVCEQFDAKYGNGAAARYINKAVRK